MRWSAGMIAACLIGLGCGQGGSTNSARDAAPDTVASLNLPDLPPGCPPGVGNENGIGSPCTRTGGECTGTLQCSCKDWFGYAMPAEMPCFCTSVSFGSTCTACGSKASCCTYDVPLQTTTITVSACFPSVCLSGGTECPSIQP